MLNILQTEKKNHRSFQEITMISWTEFNRNAVSCILEKNESGVVLNSTSRKVSPVKNSKSRKNNSNVKIVVKFCP